MGGALQGGRPFMLTVLALDQEGATLLSWVVGNRRRVEGKLPKGLPVASCVLGGEFSWPSRCL